MTSAPGQEGTTRQAKRVLIVEDELMIRMLLEDMLNELGYSIAAEAGRIDEALVARGMPFVFATGYGERGLPEAYRDRPTLKKPFQMDGLSRTLQSALDGKT